MRQRKICRLSIPLTIHLTDIYGEILIAIFLPSEKIIIGGIIEHWGLFTIPKDHLDLSAHWLGRLVYKYGETLGFSRRVTQPQQKDGHWTDRKSWTCSHTRMEVLFQPTGVDPHRSTINKVAIPHVWLLNS